MDRRSRSSSPTHPSIPFWCTAAFILVQKVPRYIRAIDRGGRLQTPPPHEDYTKTGKQNILHLDHNPPITTTAGLEPGPFSFDTQSMAIGTGQEFVPFFSLLFALTTFAIALCFLASKFGLKRARKSKSAARGDLPFFFHFSFWYGTRHWILRWINLTASDGQTDWLASQ